MQFSGSQTHTHTADTPQQTHTHTTDRQTHTHTTDRHTQNWPKSNWPMSSMTKCCDCAGTDRGVMATSFRNCTRTKFPISTIVELAFMFKEKGSHVEVSSIPRESNTEVDELSNLDVSQFSREHRVDGQQRLAHLPQGVLSQKAEHHRC